MVTLSRPAVQKKRLVTCLDGAGNNIIGMDQTPTNVVRLGRCVADIGSDGVAQQVYYHYGVSNSPKWIGNYLVEGATGKGTFEVQGKDPCFDLKINKESLPTCYMHITTYA